MNEIELAVWIALLATAITVNALCAWWFQVRAIRNDRDLWHGRTVYLRYVIDALSNNDQTEALRLLSRTHNEKRVKNVAIAEQKNQVVDRLL